MLYGCKLKKYFILLSLVTLSCVVEAQVFIPFTYWGCNPKKAAAEDVTNADFSAGTFSSTMTSGNSIMLSVGQVSGTFTSRVMDIYCGGLWNWAGAIWKSTMPYEKELTSTSETSAEYSGASGSLMNNIFAYYNLNETVANSATAGNDFADRSGNGRHATETNLGSYGVAGKFTNAAQLNGTSSRISPSSFGSTAKNYTFSFWFRTTASANNLTYLFDTLDGTNRLIIAASCSSALCSAQGFMGICYGACASLPASTIAVPNDGNWHHLVVTLNTVTGNATMFLNYVTTHTYTTYGATGYNLNAANVRIGSRYGGDNWFFNGDIDEVAVWERVLTNAEILALYRRGANRLRLQFRSCTSSTCADNPIWKGPDGTAATFFSELYNNSVQAARTGNALYTNIDLNFANFGSLGLPANRYFQYSATLQTDNVTYSPDMTYIRLSR